MTPQDEQKRACGEAAAELVQPGMVVGLGTGTTVKWLVEALGRKVAREGLRFRGVPTSVATANLATSLNIPLIELGEAPIDLTLDGADEIDPGLALIKGAGGALLREKLVWEASARCVVIADEGKLSTTLGGSPLPIEVIAFGASTTLARLQSTLNAYGMSAPLRPRLKDGAPYITDSGNLIFDVTAGRIEDPAALGRALKATTGVVEHGLFLGLAREALIGGASGVGRIAL